MPGSWVPTLGRFLRGLCLFLAARSAEPALHPRGHRPTQRSPAPPGSSPAGHLRPFAVATALSDGLCRVGGTRAQARAQGRWSSARLGRAAPSSAVPHSGPAGLSLATRGKHRRPLPTNAACSNIPFPSRKSHIARAGAWPVTYKVQPRPPLPALGTLRRPYFYTR